MISMRPLSWIAVILATTSCTAARPIMAPSGAQGIKIWCELPSQCYDRAAKACPAGYNIEANEKDYWGLGDVDGNLIITCKHPGQAPQAPIPANGATPPGQANTWWNQQRPAPATPAPTRYRCTDADGKPYVTTTPTKGCVVE